MFEAQWVMPRKVVDSVYVCLEDTNPEIYGRPILLLFFGQFERNKIGEHLRGLNALCQS